LLLRYDPEIGAAIFHGVSGVGKTMFALLLANRLVDVCAYFTLTSGSLLNRFHGESEKNLRLLFQMAQEVGPSIIFIDEGENLFAKKGNDSFSNQTSSNMSCELLTIMNNLTDVYVLVATNYPWKMDKAFRRRFAGNIHLGLPNDYDRALITKYMISKNVALVTDNQFIKIGKAMKGFTPGDIKKMVIELKHQKIKEMSYNGYFKPSPIFGGELVPCHRTEKGAIYLTFEEAARKSIVSKAIDADDIFNAIRKFTKSVSEKDIKEHVDYAKNQDYIPKEPNQVIEFREKRSSAVEEC